MIEAKRLLNDFRSRVWMSKREIVLEWIDDNRHHPCKLLFSHTATTKSVAKRHVLVN